MWALAHLLNKTIPIFLCFCLILLWPCRRLQDSLEAGGTSQDEDLIELGSLLTNRRWCSSLNPPYIDISQLTGFINALPKGKHGPLRAFATEMRNGLAQSAEERMRSLRHESLGLLLAQVDADPLLLPPQPKKYEDLVFPSALVQCDVQGCIQVDRHASEC